MRSASDRKPNADATRNLNETPSPLEDARQNSTIVASYLLTGIKGLVAPVGSLTEMSSDPSQNRTTPCWRRESVQRSSLTSVPFLLPRSSTT